eukprot:7674154-Ditylum_brightwellii.AAC.1
MSPLSMPKQCKKQDTVLKQHWEQRATNSPHIWLVISLVICDMCEQHTNGAEFTSPDKHVSILLAILGFVDNITNQVKIFQDNDVTVLELLKNGTRY